jgi:hypothetical protein
LLFGIKPYGQKKLDKEKNINTNIKMHKGRKENKQYDKKA